MPLDSIIAGIPKTLATTFKMLAWSVFATEQGLMPQQIPIIQWDTVATGVVTYAFNALVLVVLTAVFTKLIKSPLHTLLDWIKNKLNLAFWWVWERIVKAFIVWCWKGFLSTRFGKWCVLLVLFFTQRIPWYIGVGLLIFLMGVFAVVVHIIHPEGLW
ncbi:MAG TPA: hypothetical protein DCE41_04700 [Cytophagales bacterium]|nr:hypothetical protein [Cytophagales bacterium]HAA21846.1 hypothetical protein [Cytophagales bacterium]HAP64297.1 hypothetical protein [Cytophagales bacterium]